MEEIVYSRCGGVGLGVGVHVAIAVERCEPAADWGDFSLGIWLVVKGFRRARCPPSRQRNFRSPRVPVRALEITSGGSKLRGPGMCLRGRPKGDIMEDHPQTDPNRTRRPGRRRRPGGRGRCTGLGRDRLPRDDPDSSDDHRLPVRLGLVARSRRPGRHGGGRADQRCWLVPLGSRHRVVTG